MCGFCWWFMSGCLAILCSGSNVSEKRFHKHAVYNGFHTQMCTAKFPLVLPLGADTVV